LLVEKGEDNMQDHRKLKVWHRAQEISVDVYRFTADFPVEERYGITSQLRRSAVSVGANIAEGSKRRSKADKVRVFNTSESEAAEAMSVLDLAVRLRFGRKEEAERLMTCYDELLAMLARLCEQVLA
jgi:four helix bundle protein